jgi:hypothetical protein
VGLNGLRGKTFSSSMPAYSMGVPNDWWLFAVTAA